MFVLSGFSFPVHGCAGVISKPAKVVLPMLFQCKCSGTGQNEIKLSFCSAKANISLELLMQVIVYFLLYLCLKNHKLKWDMAGTQLLRFPTCPEKSIVVTSFSLFCTEKKRQKAKMGCTTQKVSVRLRAVGDFKAQDALTALGHSQTRGKGLNAC